MSGYQKVYLRVAGLVGDTSGDEDDKPDRVLATGSGSFVPTLPESSGDVQRGPDGLEEIMLPDSVPFTIVDGMVTQGGRPYVWLPVPSGSWMWQIEFNRVQIGSRNWVLKSFSFPLTAATQAQENDPAYVGINLAYYAVGAWSPGEVEALSRRMGDLETAILATQRDAAAATAARYAAEEAAGGGGFVGVLSVTSFGATGDGATDDTDAIQAALDAVPEGGGTVYFPPGRYRVGPRGLRYGSQDTYGALYPRANTRLLGAGAMSCILLEDGTEKVDVIYARQVQGLAFESLQIDAGPRKLPYWTTCLQLNSCDGLVLSSVTVTRGNIEGIYLYGCAQFRVSGIHAHANGDYRADASGLHFDTCHDGRASDLTLNNNGFHGLIVSTSWEISFSNVVAFGNGWQGIHLQTGSNKIVVNGALLRGNGRGVYIRDWGTDNNLLAGVVVAHNDFAGLMVNVAYGNVINGLQAIGNGEFGVETIEADDELIVFGAHFKDNGSGSHRAAPNSFLAVNGRWIVGTAVGDPV